MLRLNRRLILLFAVLLATGIVTNASGLLINWLSSVERQKLFDSENWWLWMCLIASILIMSILGILAFKAESNEAQPSFDSKNTGFQSQLEMQNRQALLDKVRNYWVKGVLEESLYNKARIDLGLEEHPNAIHPWTTEWMPTNQAKQVLPPKTRVIDKFKSLGEGATLLILGEPGGGKTTLLLELARDLIQQAKANSKSSIPVVLNLSSWSSKNKKHSSSNPNLTDWLIEELNSKYQIPKKVAQNWIEQEKFVLLLDGLDEVKQERRNDCIDAINQFNREYGTTEIVVCSRIKDYETLPSRLRFQAALFIQPLTLEQVDNYLKKAGAKLAGIRTALQTDSELRDLTQTPLFIWIMSLAYKGMTVKDLHGLSREDRIKHLFNEYIKSRLESYTGYQRHLNQQYPSKKVKSWLSFLAKGMVEKSQTLFLIEEIHLYQSGRHQFKAAESFKWSWKKAKPLLAAIMTMPLALLIWLVFKLRDELFLTIWLTFWLLVLLSRGVSTLRLEIKSYPNQGTWNSVINSILLGLTAGLIIGLCTGLIVGLKDGLIAGSIIGLSYSSDFGGSFCLQHFTLRFIHWNRGNIPWNFKNFLDYATERLFLNKVGGGYIFVHRSLMEHFAQLEIENH
jgi:GTPase SAR1 family protein